MNIMKGLKDAVRSFSKDNVTPSDNSSSSQSAKVALYQQQAVSELIDLLSKVPDIDEVLRTAGIPRHRLTVLLYDDEIAQACETRADAISSLALSFESSVKDLDMEDKDLLFIKEQLEKFIKNIVAGAFKSRLFGYSVMEAVYEQLPDGKIGLSYVGEKPMEWFSPRPNGELRFYKAGFSSSDGIVVDQKYKFFLTQNKPTWANPYGEALLSRLYWPWFFRQNGWKFWGKFLERFGAPLLVGKTTDTGAMVNALLLAHSQAVIAVDREDSVEAIGAGSNTGQAFDDYETAVIRRIQKVVLGQTLTSGTDGGSGGNRALGKVHNEVRIDKLKSDISLIQPTIQKIADALCSLNNITPIKVLYLTDIDLAAARALRDKDLYAVGVRFTPSYIVENYKLDTADFIITDQTNTENSAGAPNKGSNDSQNNKVKDSKNKNSKFASDLISELFFAKEQKKQFTKEQQMVEEIADDAIQNGGIPLDEETIKNAVFSATSPENLQERLMILLEESASQEEFSKAMEKALQSAQILGYVHAEKL